MADCKGLFLGLCCMDFVYYADRPLPTANTKCKVADYQMVVGGPATNAALTYAALGGRATLYAPIGNDPLATLAQQQLAARGVKLIDAARGRAHRLSLSCVYVEGSSGARTVISGQGGMPENLPHEQLADLVAQHDFVLYDGNLPGVEPALLAALQKHLRPLALDAGSHKDGFAALFPLSPEMISGEHYRDNHGHDVFSLGLARCARSLGERGVEYKQDGKKGQIAVPQVTAVDTLGAGDVLHGGFCYFRYAKQQGFAEALGRAARLASYSVTQRGVASGLAYAVQKLQDERKP